MGGELRSGFLHTYLNGGIREVYRSDSHWAAYGFFLSSVKIMGPFFNKRILQMWFPTTYNFHISFHFFNHSKSTRPPFFFSGGTLLRIIIFFSSNKVRFTSQEGKKERESKMRETCLSKNKFLKNVFGFRHGGQYFLYDFIFGPMSVSNSSPPLISHYLNRAV